MKKEEIIKEYHLNDSHLEWNPMIDNWFSVEAFRQQTGKLPNDPSVPEDPKYHLQVYMDFLDNKELHTKLMTEKPQEFGSMYLSTKRILRQHLDKF